ncbi:MAG TPA: DUF2852 domain-containing protein [Stellaceae bacterium]|nr:DUF2852 domain-containing protein [Stellaceae bacterium]
MTVVDHVDGFGRPAWIALMVLSFIMFWPVGLIFLGFLIGSGRMGCWNHSVGDRWQWRMQRGAERMRRGAERVQEAADRWRDPSRDQPPNYRPGPSGNHAFDEYRTETLRRLEDEQREFMGFLERLRHAKDKAEFDQFMADRRRYPEPPAAPPQPQ